MKIRWEIHNNIALITLIAITIGGLLSYHEISGLFESDIVVPDRTDYFIAVIHLIFFTLLSGILIYINTRTLKKAEDVWHFIYSVIVVLLFSMYTWFIHDPVAEQSNGRHAEIYEEYYRQRDDRSKNEIKGQRGKRDKHDKGKHDRYFHEKGEEWLGMSIVLLFAIYGFSRIYNMARRKEEMERKFEKLKNESLQSQISALNNQINPHFFF